MTEEFKTQLRKEAVTWGVENGMKLPIRVDEPTTGNHGYTVRIADGKGHEAVCSFKLDGSQDMYERTDRVVGA